VVARIYDPRRAVIYQRLGIPTVATVSWTTDQIMRKLFPEQVAPEWTDPSGTISVVQRPLPPAWAGRKLGGLDELDRFHLVALTRDGVTVLALPDLVGQEGDTLFLSVRKDALEELSTRLHGTDAVPGHH
jgi:trk system potassium uptake protein TrkA